MRPQRNLSMTGDISDYPNWEGRLATGTCLTGARDAAKQPTMHRTAPQIKELSRPKCQ